MTSRAAWAWLARAARRSLRVQRSGNKIVIEVAFHCKSFFMHPVISPSRLRPSPALPSVGKSPLGLRFLLLRTQDQPETSIRGWFLGHIYMIICIFTVIIVLSAWAKRHQCFGWSSLFAFTTIVGYSHHRFLDMTAIICRYDQWSFIDHPRFGASPSRRIPKLRRWTWDPEYVNDRPEMICTAGCANRAWALEGWLIEYH